MADEPAVAPAAQVAAAPAAAPAAYDWKSQLNEPELANHPSLPTLKVANEKEAITSLTKMYVNAAKLIGGAQNKVDRYNPTWTPEQKANWYQEATGAVKDAKDYNLDAEPYKEFIRPEEVEKIKSIGAKTGLNNEQLSSLAQDLFNQKIAEAKAERASTDQNLKVFDSQIKAKYGDKYQNAKDSADFAIENSNPEFKKLMSDFPDLAKHPGIFQILVDRGNLMANDSAAGALRGSSGSGIGGLPNTAAEVNAAINKWNTDEFHAKVLQAQGIENYVRKEIAAGRSPGDATQRWQNDLKYRTALYKRMGDIRDVGK